jgi:hypothetical protein
MKTIKWTTHRDFGPGRRGLFPADNSKKLETIPKIEKLKPGEIGDVIAWCEPSNPFHRLTNIPHVIQYSDDFAWGYSGAGPSDFALNILLHFTNGDEAFSRKHCINFREEIIARLKNAEAVTLPKQKVLDWIEERRLKDPVLPQEVSQYVGTFGYGGYRRTPSKAPSQ